MNGNVISITPSYGFIRDSEGISYHFSKKSMAAGYFFGDLQIGSAVEFDVAAGPKGMKANNICVVTAFTAYEINRDDLFILRAGQSLPQDKIFYPQIQVMQSQWYRSPGDAKEELIGIAKTCGANVLTNTQMLKRTFSEGNYKYTMHSFYGEAGVYARKIQLLSETDAEKLNSDNHTYVDDFKVSAVEMAKWLDKQRRGQESGGLLFIFIVFAIIITAGMTFLG